MNACIFPYFSHPKGIQCCKICRDFCFTRNMEETLDFGIFCFPVTFLYYRNLPDPCIEDNTTDVKTKFFISIPKVVNPFYLYSRSLWQGSIEIDTVQKMRQCLLRHCFFNVCNIPMNMAIAVRLKIDPGGR